MINYNKLHNSILKENNIKIINRIKINIKYKMMKNHKE